MLNTYRRNDAVIIVCQKNQQRKLEIAAVNPAAQHLSGYTTEALVGEDLFLLLEDEIVERIRDQVEFTDAGDDLADSLMRTRNLNLRTASGRPQECRLRVVRSEIVDGAPTFHLVLEDEHLANQNDEFKQVLKENFKGHEVMDDITGLPNRVSLIKDLELFQHHVAKGEMQACFALIHLDNAPELASRLGAQVPMQVLKHLGQLCNQRLRKDDTVGLISGRSIGVLLMQISPESSRVVLNRLRWSAASMPIILDTGARADPHLSLSYHMIGTTPPEQIIEACEAQFSGREGEAGNVFEVVL